MARAISSNAWQARQRLSVGQLQDLRDTWILFMASPSERLTWEGDLVLCLARMNEFLSKAI